MAAAPAVPTGSPIEALFRPTARFQGLLQEGWTEVELLPGLTLENVLASGVTWEDFHRFLYHKVAWAASDVFVCSGYMSGLGESLLSLRVDVSFDVRVNVTPGTAAAAATATCDFMVRLLATSEEHAVNISGNIAAAPPPLSGAGLSLFFQESRSCLRRVTLRDMALNEDLCRALATMSRLDVELEIINCWPADDAAGAFAECLQSGRGPVELIHCVIDNQIIASALTGKSRVTKLVLDSGRTNGADMAVLFAALANNSGLVELDVCNQYISGDNWSILCESLKAHPTLTRLDLRISIPGSQTGGRRRLPDGQKARRTRLLAVMMKENIVLHTIRVSEHERDEQIYIAEILPRLQTNLYRPRVLAVKKTKERPFREKVLGRALFCVKSNPNLVWMFLSENVDAIVRSEEEEAEEVEEGSSKVAVSVVVAASVVVAVVAEGDCKRKR
jgi:hypothetical protein